VQAQAAARQSGARNASCQKEKELKQAHWITYNSNGFWMPLAGTGFIRFSSWHRNRRAERCRYVILDHDSKLDGDVIALLKSTVLNPKCGRVFKRPGKTELRSGGLAVVAESFLTVTIAERSVPGL
jgi:hypothetical protein